MNRPKTRQAANQVTSLAPMPTMLPQPVNDHINKTSPEHHKEFLARQSPFKRHSSQQEFPSGAGDLFAVENHESMAKQTV